MFWYIKISYRIVYPDFLELYIPQYGYLCGGADVLSKDFFWRCRFRSSTVRAGGVQCKFLCLYVVVGIVGEDRELQTPADVIPLYARRIWSISVEWRYPFFTLELDFDVA